MQGSQKAIQKKNNPLEFFQNSFNTDKSHLVILDVNAIHMSSFMFLYIYMHVTFLNVFFNYL